MSVHVSLFRLIYHSQATKPFTEAALSNLLQKARQHNQAAWLSGLLLYADHHFLQVLEGPEQDVTDLYARIQADPRHRHVSTLALVPVTQRAFPDWRMAYTPADAATMEVATGFMPLAAAPGLAAHPSDALTNLLQDFAQGRAQDQ